MEVGALSAERLVNGAAGDARLPIGAGEVDDDVGVVPAVGVGRRSLAARDGRLGRVYVHRGDERRAVGVADVIGTGILHGIDAIALVTHRDARWRVGSR